MERSGLRTTGKNFFRFGYLPLKFGATLATADIRPEERKYLIHYTPALPVLISLSYVIFGVSEMSTRLVPIIASLASVFLVVLLGKELISFRAGIIAGALMAVTPMFIYYGKNPVHEIVLLPFALLAFLFIPAFSKDRRKRLVEYFIVGVNLCYVGRMAGILRCRFDIYSWCSAAAKRKN